MKKNYNLYCDESGNSGGNFLDKQQPFYVLAGWLIERNDTYRVKNRVSHFKQEYYPKKSELKGVEILKSNPGQHNANLLLKEMGEFAIPFFQIAEKRFCLAAKMVEAYLDPLHNNNVPISHTWKNGERKKIANLIYNLAKESIEMFGEAYKEVSKEKYTIALDLLIEELNYNGYIKLASAFSGAYEFMEAIYDEEFTMIDVYPEKAMRSLNLPVFTSFIQMIERSTSNVGIKNIKLFHDNTKQFEATYPDVFQLYARKKEEEVAYQLQDGQILLSSLKTLRSISFSDSKESPIIQASDILASFLNAYTTKISFKKRLSPELEKFGEFLIGGLLANEGFEGNGFCDIIASDYFRAELLYSKGLINNLPKKESLLESQDYHFHLNSE
ncbi:hypothetical protein CHH55_23310 [Niallia circulans]|uniref:DUF3800 domain-containing protein n=1 Tax=Niallia circulans TaxID=1397 RepID=UPI000BA65E5B|nr:DUF3800 domain-containing protein [Niallia circulans]PAD85462.1 hypothetical protein CHH55_23310 [Niallia circulans]